MSRPGDPVRVRSLEEAEGAINSLRVNVEELRRLVRDHSDRFDTLQTPLWRRVAFWVDGWPWHDLNAPGRARRPWHRGD